MSLEDLKQTKEVYAETKIGIDKGFEPKEKLELFVKKFEQFRDNAELYKDDPELEKYMYVEVIPGIVKRLVREKTKDNEYLGQIEKIMHLTTDIFLREFEKDNSDMADAARYLFDIDSILHTYHFQDNKLEALIRDRNAQQQWRKDLKPGDQIDAIKVDLKFDCKAWAKAQVVEVKQESVNVTFPDDSSYFDRNIDLGSNEIAEAGSRKEDYQWRYDLQPEEFVDVLDTAKMWYNSTILDRRAQRDAHDREFPESYIAFRVYTEEGTKVDEEGKKFNGWTSRYDEWISTHSPRIQKFNTVAKKFNSKQSNYEDIGIDDSVDLLLDISDKQIFAVGRVRKCTSQLMIDMVNKLGESGFFDKFITRLQDRENPIQIELLSYYMEILGRISPLLFRLFVNQFVPQIRDNVKNCILNLPETHLRDVRKERIQGIIKSLDTLLKRMYQSDDRAAVIDEINLAISLLCIQSKFLERRIHGIKQLVEFIKNFRSMMGTKTFTQTYLVEWIRNHKILEEVFSPSRSHIQLVQRSADIIRFIISADKISNDELQLIWDATKQGDQIKNEVYGVIKEICSPLNFDQTEFITQKIDEIAPEKVVAEELDVLYAMGKYTKGTARFSIHIVELLWRIATEQDKGYKKEVSELGVENFCKIVISWEKPTKEKYFTRCIENIKEHRSPYQCIKILKKMIKDMGEQEVSSSSSIGMTQSSINKPTQEIPEHMKTNAVFIQYLIHTHGLLDVFFADFDFYTNSVKEVLKTNEELLKDEKSTEKVLYGSFTHVSNIEERLDFLRYIAQESTYKISRDQLNYLWNSLNTNSLFASDQEALYKWLKESCENTVKSASIVDVEEIGEFFNEKLANSEKGFAQLSLDGFSCIQSYFLLVNERENKLQRTNVQSANSSSKGAMGKQAFGSYNNQSGATYLSYSWNNKYNNDSDEVEFRIYDLPSKLSGIDNIWSIALESEQKNVYEKATDLVIKMCQNLAPEIEQRKEEIEDEFIKICMFKIKDIQANKPAATQQTQICRVINLLKNLIVETEKLGTGGLRPHSAILNGSLLPNIQISNYTAHGKDVPRKFELSLFQNNTIYDLKKIVAKKTGLTPAYIRLSRCSGSTDFKDSENGKTLSEMRFKPNEAIILYKKSMANVPKAPLVASNGALTPEARRVFEDWFSKFSTDQKMSPAQAAEFVRSCTEDNCRADDPRIIGLFNTHDANKDGFIEVDEFVEFYRICSVNKADVVRQNILAHNYRNDLKKISEVEEEEVDKEKLPRLKIAKHEEYFNLLFQLLERNDQIAQEAWNLIQRLCTNPTIFEKVLTIHKQEKIDGKIAYANLIESKSIYKLLYELQIIESLITDGDTSKLQKLTVIKEKKEVKQEVKKVGGENAMGPQASATDQPPQKEVSIGPGDGEGEPVILGASDEDTVQALLNLKKGSQQQQDQAQSQGQDSQPQAAPGEEDEVEYLQNEMFDSEEIKDFKQNWTLQFLECGGFEFIFRLFNEKRTLLEKGSEMNKFEKNFLGFLLSIMRLFIMAAFQAQEPSIQEKILLVRQASSTNPKDEDEPKKGDKQDEPMIEITPVQGSGYVPEAPPLNNYETPKKPTTGDVLSGDPEAANAAYDPASDTYSINPSTQALRQYLFNEDEPQGNASKKEEEKKEQDQPENLRIKELASQMTNEMAQSIIDQVDFKQLQILILETISMVLEKQEITIEDQLIVDKSMNLWVNCVMYKNELLEHFYTFQNSSSFKIVTNAETFLIQGLYCFKRFRIRSIFNQMFECLGKAVVSTNISRLPLIFALEKLSQDFPIGENNERKESKEFFELFGSFLDTYYSDEFQNHEKFEKVINQEALVATVIEKFKKHKSRETRKSLIEDKTLCGYLNLLEKLISNSADLQSLLQKIAIEQGLIHELFFKCLFPEHFEPLEIDITEDIDINSVDLDSQKCKTKESRHAAFKLLWALAKSSPQTIELFLRDCMIPMTQRMKKQKSWNYSPAGESKNGRFVGIKNLGCICYMNSMLQQFFMVPTFRYNLLKADDGIPEDMVEYKQKMHDDNMLHQIQKMFGFLEMSERQDYDPSGFCFSFKDWEGNPTNTAVQQDCQEFLNMIFDRLENLLRPTPQKYLTQSVFGGKTCSQIVCTQCNHVNERFEDFYNLSLEIKNRKDVHESLSKMVDFDIINDYRCGACDQKVDVKKRTVISHTPNVLIVHLQRIGFNFDTFMNDKDNSKFEFPNTLDLKAYSYEELGQTLKATEPEDGKEAEVPDADDDDENESPLKAPPVVVEETDECYQYKLVGVTIHIGTADAGHYYSYINTKRGKNSADPDKPEWLKTDKDPWREFNDSQVKDYKFGDLQGDCFGGSGGDDDGIASFYGRQQSYGKSAYMLIYEKQIKDPLREVIKEEEVSEEMKNSAVAFPIGKGMKIKEYTSSSVFFDIEKEEYYKLNAFTTASEKFIPNRIYKEAFADNNNFIFEKQTYSNEFFLFMKDVMKGVKQLNEERAEKYNGAEYEQIYSNVNEAAIVVGSKMCLDVLVKAFYNGSYKESASILISLLQSSDQACIQFMKTQWDADKYDYLFEILFTCTDKGSRNHTADILSAVINRLFHIEKDHLNQEHSYAIPFLVRLLNKLPVDGPKNWVKLEAVQNILKDVVQGGLEQVKFFWKHNQVSALIDFILGKQSPLCQPGENRTAMGSSYTNPNFKGAVSVISTLIRHSYTPTFTAETENKENNEYYIPGLDLTLDDQSQMMWNIKEFYSKCLKEGHECVELGKAMTHWCYNNKDYSRKIAQLMLKGLNSPDYEKVKNYMEAIRPFLLLKDKYQTLRLEQVLGTSILEAKIDIGNSLKIGMTNLLFPRDEVSRQVSPILNGMMEDSVLHQLWRYKGKMDMYTLNCLSALLQLMSDSEEIAKYVARQQSPNYFFARYSDWIEPYLNDQLAEAKRSTYYTSMYKNEETIQSALQLFQTYKERLAKMEEEEGKIQPQIIIKATDQKEVFTEIKENIEIKVVEITAEYCASKPTGHGNDSIPSDYFTHTTTQNSVPQRYFQQESGQDSSYPNSRSEGYNIKVHQTLDEDNDRMNVSDDGIDHIQGSYPNKEGTQQQDEAQQDGQSVNNPQEEPPQEGAPVQEEQKEAPQEAAVPMPLERGANQDERGLIWGGDIKKGVIGYYVYLKQSEKDKSKREDIVEISIGKGIEHLKCARGAMIHPFKRDGQGDITAWGYLIEKQDYSADLKFEDIEFKWGIIEGDEVAVAGGVGGLAKGQKSVSIDDQATVAFYGADDYGPQDQYFDAEYYGGYGPYFPS